RVCPHTAVAVRIGCADIEACPPNGEKAVARRLRRGAPPPAAARRQAPGLPRWRLSAGAGQAISRARLDAWQGFGYQDRGAIMRPSDDLWLSTLPAVPPPWTIPSICGRTPVFSRPR